MEPETSFGVSPSLYSAIELRFRAILPIDFTESDQLFKSINESEAYKWIHTSDDWNSSRVSLEPRIEGMMKTCQGFISAVEESHLIAAKGCDYWPALVLGSLALCIRVCADISGFYSFTTVFFINQIQTIESVLNRPRKCFQ